MQAYITRKGSSGGGGAQPLVMAFGAPYIGESYVLPLDFIPLSVCFTVTSYAIRYAFRDTPESAWTNHDPGFITVSGDTVTIKNPGGASNCNWLCVGYAK